MEENRDDSASTNASASTSASTSGTNDTRGAEKRRLAWRERMALSAAGGGLGLVRELREFATRGNVLDLSVGVTVGAAFSQGFSRLSSALIHDILSPLTGLLSQLDLGSLYVNLSGRPFDSLSQARAAGAPVVAYGAFIAQLLDFALIGGILMLFMRGVNRFKRGQEPEPVAHECPFCLSSVPLKASRCRFCTSQLEAELDAEALEESTHAAPVAPIANSLS